MYYGKKVSRLNVGVAVYARIFKFYAAPFKPGLKRDRTPFCFFVGTAAAELIIYSIGAKAPINVSAVLSATDRHKVNTDIRGNINRPLIFRRARNNRVFADCPTLRNRSVFYPNISVRSIPVNPNIRILHKNTRMRFNLFLPNRTLVGYEVLYFFG